MYNIIWRIFFNERIIFMKHFKKAVAFVAAVSLISAYNAIFSLSQGSTSSAAFSAVTELKKDNPDSQTVYDIIIALKNKYPTGTSWGDDKSYAWKGGIYSKGYGCVAFAFMLSDAAFGNLPARSIKTYNPSDVYTGDIIYYKGHSIVVLERRENGFIVAEGNVNDSVIWGRLITDDEIRANFGEHITRYPVLDLGDVNADGKIDSTDASLVLADFALVQTGKSSQITANRKKAADVNKDSKVDSSDASKILEYYAMLSTGKNPSWN